MDFRRGCLSVGGHVSASSSPFVLDGILVSPTVFRCTLSWELRN